jgi:hypothetical protein
MNARSIFRTGVALGVDYPYYVLRQADQDALDALNRGKLIYTIAPRQMGKTSLLKRLISHLEAERWSCCLIDLSTFKNLERSKWFQHLGELVAQTCKISTILPSIEDQLGFKKFLFETIELRTDPSVKLALFFDEIEGLLGLDFSDPFLMTLRHLHQQPDTYSGRFQTALAGFVETTTLVTDPNCSPFNVAESVALHDFTASESFSLTRNLAQLSVPVDTPVHSRIYYWAAGQPYLTQRICEIIEGWTRTRQIDHVSTGVVDRIVNDRLLSPDFSVRDQNVKHVLRKLEKIGASPESAPAKLWKRVLTGDRVYSSEAGFAALELTGAVNKDATGRVKIRNPIYERAFAEVVKTTGPKTWRPSRPVVVRLKLQLTQRPRRKVEVRVLDSPMGESGAVENRLPYTPDQLVTILKALRAEKYDDRIFTPTERQVLERLRLLCEDHFVSNLRERVGRALYRALMVNEIENVFQMALNEVRPTQGVVSLELRFDEDAVELAQYPWELLYHRQALLLSRVVELTRYISYAQATTRLSVSPPLRLLYIQSRPTDLSWLDSGEKSAVRQALSRLEKENLIQVAELDRPTYHALLNYLEAKKVHVLHFDGHGIFARQCPECGGMNYPHHTHCQAGDGCTQGLAGAEACGYLAFEDEQTHQVKWIKSSIVGNMLSRRPLRLAVLSACRSGSVGGDLLFSGIAPALIQAGVPAVLATQLPISASAAADFMDGFYRALARLEWVPAAVNAGRLRIPEREWFIPTLYLRSKDEGYLFAPAQGE